jgi:hypothetical protein
MTNIGAATDGAVLAAPKKKSTLLQIDYVVSGDTREVEETCPPAVIILDLNPAAVMRYRVQVTCRSKTHYLSVHILFYLSASLQVSCIFKESQPLCGSSMEMGWVMTSSARIR